MITNNVQKKKVGQDIQFFQNIKTFMLFFNDIKDFIMTHHMITKKKCQRKIAEDISSFIPFQLSQLT